METAVDLQAGVATIKLLFSTRVEVAVDGTIAELPDKIPALISDDTAERSENR